jgi:hypothetical protein
MATVFYPEAVALVRSILSGENLKPDKSKIKLFDFMGEFGYDFYNWLCGYNFVPNGAYCLASIGRNNDDADVNPFYKRHLKENCKAYWRITKIIGKYWKLPNKETGELVNYGKGMDARPYLEAYKQFIDFLHQCGLVLVIHKQTWRYACKDVNVYTTKEYEYTDDRFGIYDIDEYEFYGYGIYEECNKEECDNIFIVNPSIDSELPEEPMVYHSIEYESE